MSDAELLDLAERALGPHLPRQPQLSLEERHDGQLQITDGNGDTLAMMTGPRAREAMRAALLELIGAAPTLPPPASALDLSPLSDRERQVVAELAAGNRLAAIAKRLGVSNHTARNHLKHVFRKLGVHSQVELLSKMGGRS